MSYTLRKITKGNQEMNFHLGKYYLLTQSELVGKKEFKKELEKYEIDNSNGIIYALVHGEDPSKPPIPIYASQQNYIMDGGKTISTIRFSVKPTKPSHGIGASRPEIDD